VSFVNATAKTGWLPQHWRRSLAAYAALLAVVAAADGSLALRRGRHEAAPAPQTRINDANRVTTPAVTAKVSQILVADGRQREPAPTGGRD
jgi:hypothetical protein